MMILLCVQLLRVKFTFFVNGHSRYHNCPEYTNTKYFEIYVLETNKKLFQRNHFVEQSF